MVTGFLDGLFLFLSLFGSTMIGDVNHGLAVGLKRLLRVLTGIEISIPNETPLVFELEVRLSRTEFGLGA
ncbi:hypothetical protein HanIR_Chr07g0329911 [Helianthus annuus]|nr:hypothetical protein HanIR_Chr07g0329911 [Helianthus annuus]